VQQFHHRSQPNRSRTALPCRKTVAQQKQRGPQPFAASPEEIAGQLGNRREGYLALACEFLFHQNEVVANKVKNLLSREQGDDVPPN
jgi:hypothetical protein